MASQPPYQSFVTLYFTEALPRQTNYSVPFFTKKTKTFTDCALLDQVHSLQIEKTQVFIIA